MASSVQRYPARRMSGGSWTLSQRQRPDYTAQEKLPMGHGAARLGHMLKLHGAVVRGNDANCIGAYFSSMITLTL